MREHGVTFGVGHVNERGGGEYLGIIGSMKVGCAQSRKFIPEAQLTAVWNNNILWQIRQIHRARGYDRLLEEQRTTLDSSHNFQTANLTL